MLLARLSGGAFRHGVVSVTLTRDGAREELRIVGGEVLISKPDMRMTTPCWSTYRYNVTAERLMSGRAMCPEDALKVASQREYDKKTLSFAPTAFKQLAAWAGQRNATVRVSRGT